MKSKIFILTIFCLALIIVLFSCKKKNPETGNNPPNQPSVFDIVEDTSQLGENILFTASAIDPDNDSIAFRFDWSYGDTSDWSDFVASGDTISMYHSFSSTGTFYIRAQAKDNHDGLSDWSEPDSVVIEVEDTVYLRWVCATPSAPWTERHNHTTVVFDNKIWIIGGEGPYGHKLTNDVWFSSDGLNWTCATESAPWSPRCYHASVIFDNKIWVLGGWAILDSLSLNTGPINDVWFSTEGVNWVCATDSARWLPRLSHAAVFFDNKIWVLGGGDRQNDSLFDDVWYSTDGLNWICATESAGWTGKMNFPSFVFDNKIWLIGGEEHSAYLSNDIWFSLNGVEWQYLPNSQVWIRRSRHTSVVFDNKIWVLGGHHQDTLNPSFIGPSNDVWYSELNWNWNWILLLNDSAPWHKRQAHTSVVFDNKIWVIGGELGGGALNDVWYGEIVHGKR